MGFFHLHRASSSASSRSTSSVFSAASSHGTPRSSTDSADDYMTATLKPQTLPPRTPPLLSLPFEILQHIASYLDDASAAKFSLSNKSICYSIGTRRLANYISSSPSHFDARDRLAETIERALPGAWHCAWCETFHAWDLATSTPSSPAHLNQPPCSTYNSYISSSPSYTVRYHHIRLALAAHAQGPAHGIPLSSFTQRFSSTLTLFNTPIQASTSHSAKIKHAHLLLHTSISLLLPLWTTTHKSLITHLWPLLPPSITQHRSSPHGHTGLMAALDNVARRGWRVLGTQGCSECDTDWAVSAYAVPRSAAGEFVRVDVRTWRDLGDGRSPFESGWRGHGVWIAGAEGTGCGKGEGREVGGVREVFEQDESLGRDGWRGGDDGGESEEEGTEWEKLAWSWQVEKMRGEEREREKEWRAIWRYIERRAGGEIGGSC